MRRRAASLALGLLLAAVPAGAGPTYRVAASWTEAGAAGPLREPMGIDVALDGRVFVADSRDGRVVELSADGGFVRRFTGLKKPVDVAVVPDGTVYVADYDADQVKAFGPRGKLLRAWGGPGKAAGRFHSPAGVAVDAAGDVYVSDFYNDRVQVFDSSGTWLRSIGRKGRGKGELDYPTGLAFDREGHLIVADSYNHRLQTFTPDGKALGRIGSRWRSFLGLTGSLRVPTGVAVDRAGRIAVADSGHGRVVFLGRDGSYRGEWRLLGGVRAGVYSPERVAWAPGGDLLAVDTAGDRV
ncbi:MAG: NHL repeat-containing protein, partial [Elusimicrobia bacterium]|nr:NHL repeat-containing protein [Elusimicrobiota bacterium]